MAKIAAVEAHAALQRAIELFKKGRLRESRSIALSLLKQHPTFSPALQLAGILASELGSYEEAIRHFRRAVELAPSAGAHLNLGKALEAAGRIDDAVVQFGNALQLNAAIPDVHIACGSALAKLDRFLEAAERYREAIRLAPASRDARYNLAKVLSRLGEHEAAHKAWKEVALREPHLIEVPLRLSESSQALCRWNNYSSYAERLKEHFFQDHAEPEDPPAGIAFWSLLHSDDPVLQRRASECERDKTAAVAQERLRFRPHSRIRVAYVSADFRRHATTKLAADLMETHDRTRFEVIGVALNKNDGSADYDRIRSAFDVWLDAHDVSSVARIAEMLRERRVDIAVDLMGFTAHSRSGIFARRAAPVQVNFLGFPGTSAIPSMDYIVVDPFIATEELRTATSEKLVILPDCYQCNDGKRSLPSGALTRVAQGLPPDVFVFASFNHQRKITPEAFDVWMGVLRRVERSVLWLYVGGTAAETAATNLRLQAAKCDVAPERLVFARSVPHDEHLARMQLADLVFDTFPYGAHTTASDALWAGCPVLTRAGRSFASRVCGSLLTTVGVPELIVSNWQEYEDLAVNLARDPYMYTEVKSRILRARESRLFDTPRYCSSLEKAYAEMMRVVRSGGKPAEIDVRLLL